MRSIRVFALALLLFAPFATAQAQFTVTFDTSLDGTNLQDILDHEFGPGAIDAMTDYEGYLGGDADPSYWEDFTAESIIIREIAGNARNNILGWYEETLTGMPVIDGVDDGVVFDGPAAAGDVAYIDFGGQITRFGLYLNPNGHGDATNAPEPELFFTNRAYNDIGPDGSGATFPPMDGDVQFLVYNVSHLRGEPAYIVAIEDLDYGSPLCNGTWNGHCTDNDFNDMVIEIRAESPVSDEAETFGSLKARFGN